MTIPNNNDDNDASYAGMTLREIERKHRLLRGSDTLKYLGERRLRCQTTCGLDDMVTGEWEQRKVESHQCMIAPHVNGDHEFSSECGGSRFREVVQ